MVWYWSTKDSTLFGWFYTIYFANDKFNYWSHYVRRVFYERPYCRLYMYMDCNSYFYGFQYTCGDKKTKTANSKYKCKKCLERVTYVAPFLFFSNEHSFIFGSCIDAWKRIV